MGHLAWHCAVPTLLRAATGGMSPQTEKSSVKHRFGDLDSDRMCIFSRSVGGEGRSPSHSQTQAHDLVLRSGCSRLNSVPDALLEVLPVSGR